MSLTIDEIYNKRQQLQNDIVDLINKFEKETETEIIKIKLNSDQIIDIKLRTGLE